MTLYADLHIHSKYSRACSKDLDLEHLAWWARRKGITVVGTGDFTHPAWAEELATKLVPAEPGLFRLRDDLDREVLRTLPPSCHSEVRFLLEVEISTIYKRGDRTRKVHHLCYVPDLEAAGAMRRQLGKIGNIGSDGRPILGLDSRDLLEITLAAGEGAFLVPAHVWTPWFAVLGSKSGFDHVEECYGDLADHIMALETGLSSDPEMNWTVSRLDRYRLTSNSDAHSPGMLGRNATALDVPLDYHAVRNALATGDGYVGTIDLFPEEGKYHLDGHRKCNVRLEPAQTRALGGDCPACGKPLTIGVLYRVEELADRGLGARPETGGRNTHLVPLPEIMGEILGVGPKSKAVQAAVDGIVAELGPEMAILLDMPLEEIARARRPLLVEAVDRLRRGQVHREGGYDGEYGRISLFEPGELNGGGAAADAPALFDLPDASPAPAARPPRQRGPEPSHRPVPAVPPPRAAAEDSDALSGFDSSSLDGPSVDAPPLGSGASSGSDATSAAPSGSAGPDAAALLDALDPDQREAAELTQGPLLILAGPGTGKTRTLTHRLAHLVTARGVPASECLALTFTRRAREEMRERLDALVPAHAARMTVTTFHGLGLAIVRDQAERLGLPGDVRVADESQRLAVLRDLPGVGTDREARRTLEALSRVRRTAAARAGGDGPYDGVAADERSLVERYEAALRERGLVDFDDLIAAPVTLLATDADLAAHYRARYRWICVDEYQDVDELQYRMLRLLTPPDGNLCAIGDPDQAIYGFRGADVRFFLRFREDFPGARTVELTRNYRSSAVIVGGALAAIAPATLAPGRTLTAMRSAPAAERIGVRSVPDEAAEAAAVVRTIDELLGGSSFHSRDSGAVEDDGVRGGLSFDDIAVLYRTDAQARAFVEALSRAGMPFQKRSHDRLSDRPGVRELLHDLALPRQAVPQQRIPLPELLRDAARRAVAAIGSRGQSAGETEIERASEVHAAVELLLPLAEAHAADRERFLAELALGAEVDTWDPRADRISLLTLHAAKGLEWPVVFLVGCEDGLLPLRWPGADPAEAARAEAEERRLFFVGMSRAQTHLYLSHASRRTRQGRELDVQPSPFLAALGPELAERTGSRARPRPRDRQLRML